MHRALNQKIWLCLFIMTAGIAIPAISLAQSEKLKSVHEWIEEAYPSVDHIDSTEYLQELEPADDVIVFDVREPAEYEVSHLKDAIQVNPDISQQDFIEQFGKIVKDKQVVFYCSVGRRSSLLADRVSDSLIDQGTADIFNLKHGIFGWHDKQNPLVNRNEKTDYVHPFSWRWKRYLKRKEFARYEVE